MCINQNRNIHVRTNIVIDDELMTKALEASGAATKREVVELGLRMLIKMKNQEKIRKYRGKLNWDGDLAEQRRLR